MGPNADYPAKIERLKQQLAQSESVLILTHDFPDPDCLASAFGLQHLFSYWGITSSTISFGGFVGRAENRAMVRFANIESVPFMLVSIEDYDHIVLVDTFPGLGNLSLAKDAAVHAVFDHHPHSPPPSALYFHDIRQDLGATSTLITKYLLSAGCPIPAPLATALFYGIKTDTNEMSRNASAEDLECYKLLFDKADHRLLSRIEWPDRDAEYFRILHTASQGMTIYGNVGHTHLGLISAPDYVAEIADLFDSLQTIRWMVCTGVFKNQIYYSIRTKDSEAGDISAGEAAEKMGKQLKGSGGGHSNMAAGRIPMNGMSRRDALDMLVEAMRQIFCVEKIKGQQLLADTGQMQE
jgi:nanoRNase/pAp phosphatase (c-di-AMP/oligoRNAs hydrolase)